MLDPHSLTRLIQTSLPDAAVTVTDMRGDGQYYAASVICPQFAGRSRVDQHRMVYAALGDLAENIENFSLLTAPPKAGPPSFS